MGVLAMAERLRVARANKRYLIGKAYDIYEAEKKAMLGEDRETFLKAWSLVAREENEEEEGKE